MQKLIICYCSTQFCLPELSRSYALVIPYIVEMKQSLQRLGGLQSASRTTMECLGEKLLYELTCPTLSQKVTDSLSQLLMDKLTHSLSHPLTESLLSHFNNMALDSKCWEKKMFVRNAFFNKKYNNCKGSRKKKFLD